MPAEEFTEQLSEVFRVGEQKRQPPVTAKAGDLHRAVGGYPRRNSHRMPVCCDMMRSAMQGGDVIVSEPPKGRGATMTIRYQLPRSRQGLVK